MTKVGKTQHHVLPHRWTSIEDREFSPFNNLQRVCTKMYGKFIPLVVNRLVNCTMHIQIKLRKFCLK